jgi:hypothetical protein
MARTATLRASVDRLGASDQPVSLGDAGARVATDTQSETVTLRIELAVDKATIAAIFEEFRKRDISLALGLPMFAAELERSMNVGSATRKAFQLDGLPSSRPNDGKADPRFLPHRVGKWLADKERQAAPRPPGRPRKRGA